MTTRVTENVGLTVYNDFAQDLATSSGLTFGYKGGSVIKLGVMYSIPAGTLVLSADSTNIVYVDLLEAPTVSVSTIGNKPSRAASIFLYAVTTSGNQVSSVIDLRNWLTGSTTDESAVQPSPAPPQGTVFEVSISDNGSQYGFIEGTFGSISPLSYGIIDVERIAQSLSAGNVTLILEGTHSENLITGISLSDDGGYYDFEVGDGNYQGFTQAGGSTFWQWLVGSFSWGDDSGNTEYLFIRPEA